MSLKFFHIVFITLSTLMCLVVGLWALDAYRTDGALGTLALMVLAFAGGGLLVVYGNRFLQKTRKLGVAWLLIAGTLGLPSDLLACTVCLGNTESSLRDGMNAGILALLGFALFMIVCFAAFFIYLWRRSTLVAGSEFQVPGSGPGSGSRSRSGLDGETAHA
jgi:hypothetical protein